MPRPATLQPTPSGTYYRQLGYTATKTQPRFNLGTSKAEALGRNAELEDLWRLVRDRAAGTSTDPMWDEVTLAMAREGVAGATRFTAPTTGPAFSPTARPINPSTAAPTHTPVRAPRHTPR